MTFTKAERNLFRNMIQQAQLPIGDLVIGLSALTKMGEPMPDEAMGELIKGYAANKSPTDPVEVDGEH